MSGSPFSLEGKRILVTGASSGVGAATARLCAGMGARVILCGRDRERLAPVLDSLDGDGHIVITGDLRDDAARQALAAAAPALDGCVFAASSGARLGINEITQAHLDEVFAVNVHAPVLLTRALLEQGKIGRGASLVYLAGAARHWAFGGSAAHAGSQAALTAAVRAIAVECAGQGIRANCVAPGYVEPMQAQGHEQSPLGAIEPDDVAAGIAYLLVPASRWVSRTSLLIDGGLSLHVR